MNFKSIPLAVFMLMFSAKLYAISFDYIAPSNVFFNQNELGSGIGSPFWGLLIATNDVLTQEILEGAVINTSIDNPNIILNQSGKFMNLHLYAPLLAGEVAGYSSAGPVTDSSVLLAHLNTGETLKDPNGQIQGQGILFEDDWLGSANVDYEIIIGDQHVEFTTQLHFVESLADSLWVEVTDGIRLTSTSISPVPEPASIWLLGSGLIGLFGYNYKRKNKLSSKSENAAPRRHNKSLNPTA